MYTYDSTSCSGNYLSSQEYPIDSTCQLANDGDDFLNGGIGYSTFTCVESTDTTDGDGSSSSDGLSTGAITGIAIAGFVVAIIVAVSCFWFGVCKCCKKDSMQQNLV